MNEDNGQALVLLHGLHPCHVLLQIFTQRVSAFAPRGLQPLRDLYFAKRGPWRGAKGIWSLI